MTMFDSTLESSLLECETTFVKIPMPWNFETRLEINEFEVARMLEEHQQKMEEKVHNMLPQLKQEMLENQQQLFQQHTQKFNEVFQKQQQQCQQLIQYFTKTLEENVKVIKSFNSAIHQQQNEIGSLKDLLGSVLKEKNVVELMKRPFDSTTTTVENNKTESLNKVLPYSDGVGTDQNSQQQFQSQYETCCEDEMASVENVVLQVDSADNIQLNNNVEIMEDKVFVEEISAPSLDVPKLDAADADVENVDQIFSNALELYEQASKKHPADKPIPVNNKKKGTKGLKINVKSNFKTLDNNASSSLTAKTQPTTTSTTTNVNMKATLPLPSNASIELSSIPSKRGKPRNAKSKINKPDNDNIDDVPDNDDDGGDDDDDYVPGKVPVFERKLSKKPRSRKRSISENADIQKSEDALPQIMETLSIDDIHVKQDKRKGGNVGRSKSTAKTSK